MSIRVEAGNVSVGMFIAELDRPWIDTPFLLQGFLVENDVELSQLRRYCKFVLVDPKRSATGLFPAAEGQELRPRVPAAAVSKVGGLPGNTGPASVSTKKIKDTAADSRSSSSEEQQGEVFFSDSGRFKAITSAGQPARAPDKATSAAGAVNQPPAPSFGSFLERLGGLFSARGKRRGNDRAAVVTDGSFIDVEAFPTRPVRHDFVPASIQITYYPETKAIEEEIAPARQAYARVEDLARQVIDDIRNGKLIDIDQIEEVISDVVESMVRSADALIWVVRLKQQDTAIYGHSLQVAVYLVSLGRHLGLPKEHLARLATLGLLLDVGKTKLPRTLLAKPVTLTPDEFELIKQHVRVGLNLLGGTPGLHPEILDGVAHHHEREDGSGYPEGRRSESISLFGRMAAIADTFVALTNTRPHVDPISSYEALRKLTSWSGTLFHPPLVEQFIQAVGVFPIGSLVELSTGEIGVVVRQNKVRRLKPRVLVISGPDKTPAPSPSMLDLLHQHAVNDPVHILRGLAVGAYGLDAREYYLS